MIWGYPYFRKPSYIHIQDYSEFIQSFYACCLTSLMSCCSVSGFSLVSVFLVVFLIFACLKLDSTRSCIGWDQQSPEMIRILFRQVQRPRYKHKSENINMFVNNIHIYTIYTFAYMMYAEEYVLSKTQAM